MANQTIIPVGNQVEGDITSCKIENQVISVQKLSAFSIQKRTTYASYDVCSKQIIQQYTIPEINDFGVMVIFIITICIVISLISWINR